MPASALRTSRVNAHRDEASSSNYDYKGSRSPPSNELLTIRINSRSPNESSLTLPAALVLLREEEMRASALQFDIPPERWQGSLLYRECLRKRQPSIRLDPELFCADHNYSQHFQWAPWLTRLILEYYQTGQLQVRSDCVGFDLLLALEYFGILYAPDQLVFDTYAAYTRVRHWSDYFTQRTHVADWVANEVVDAEASVQFHAYCVSGNSQEVVEVGRSKQVLPALQGGEKSNSSDHQNSGAALWDFFVGIDLDYSRHRLNNNDDRPPNRGSPHSMMDDDSKVTRHEAADIMRQDFAMYLQNILTCVRVSFPMQTVTVDGAPQQRAVLVVHVMTGGNNQSPHNDTSNGQGLDRSTESPIRPNKSDLSHPLDELSREGFGKLDSLLGTTTSNRPKPNSNKDPPAASSNDSPRQALDDIYESVYTDLRKAEVAPPPSRPSPLEQQYQHHQQQQYQQQQYEQNFHRRPSLRKVSTGMSNSSAPIGVIDIRAGRSMDKSVTSALTGPFFLDESGRLRDVQAQALRQEWIQGNLLNRNIEHRVREILDDEIVMEPGMANSKATDHWDWLRGLCAMTCEVVQTTPCAEIPEVAANVMATAIRTPPETERPPPPGMSTPSRLPASDSPMISEASNNHSNRSITTPTASRGSKPSISPQPRAEPVADHEEPHLNNSRQHISISPRTPPQEPLPNTVTPPKQQSNVFFDTPSYPYNSSPEQNYQRTSSAELATPPTSNRPYHRNSNEQRSPLTEEGRAKLSGSPAAGKPPLAQRKQQQLSPEQEEKQRLLEQQRQQQLEKHRLQLQQRQQQQLELLQRKRRHQQQLQQKQQQQRGQKMHGKNHGNALDDKGALATKGKLRGLFRRKKK